MARRCPGRARRCCGCSRCHSPRGDIVAVGWDLAQHPHGDGEWSRGSDLARGPAVPRGAGTILHLQCRRAAGGMWHCHVQADISQSVGPERKSALPCHPAVSPPDPTRNSPALLWLLRVGCPDHEQIHISQGHQEVLTGGIVPICAAPGALCHTGVTWGLPSPTAPSSAPGASRVTSPV